MIQRIQSVYLFLTTILSLLFLRGSFLQFINNSGFVIKVTFRGIIDSASQGSEITEKLLPLTLLMIIIPVLSLITIFLFRNRKVQMLLTRFLILLCSAFLLLSGYYSYSIITRYEATLVPVFRMIIPVLLLTFSILALRGIKKDDNLVRSYDRLR